LYFVFFCTLEINLLCLYQLRLEYLDSKKIGDIPKFLHRVLPFLTLGYSYYILGAWSDQYYKAEFARYLILEISFAVYLLVITIVCHHLIKLVRSVGRLPDSSFVKNVAIGNLVGMLFFILLSEIMSYVLYNRWPRHAIYLIFDAFLLWILIILWNSHFKVIQLLREAQAEINTDYRDPTRKVRIALIYLTVALLVVFVVNLVNWTQRKYEDYNHLDQSPGIFSLFEVFELILFTHFWMWYSWIKKDSSKPESTITPDSTATPGSSPRVSRVSTPDDSKTTSPVSNHRLHAGSLNGSSNSNSSRPPTVIEETFEIEVY